ncbi:unnamed protein product, partial [Ceratitis capitata]
AAEAFITGIYKETTQQLPNQAAAAVNIELGSVDDTLPSALHCGCRQTTTSQIVCNQPQVEQRRIKSLSKKEKQ